MVCYTLDSRYSFSSSVRKILNIYILTRLLFASSLSDSSHSCRWSISSVFWEVHSSIFLVPGLVLKVLEVLHHAEPHKRGRSTFGKQISQTLNKTSLDMVKRESQEEAKE